VALFVHGDEIDWGLMGALKKCDRHASAICLVRRVKWVESENDRDVKRSRC
jgi:hypothetical protein